DDMQQRYQELQNVVQQMEHPRRQERGPSYEGSSHHVWQGIMDALAPSSHYEMDENGTLQAVKDHTSPGQFAQKVIAGALQGFSAAGRVQRGPGYTARAAAAGTGQGLQYAQQQDTRERAQANEDYERQQQQLVRKAQGVMLRQTFATQILQYKRLKF